KNLSLHKQKNTMKQLSNFYFIIASIIFISFTSCVKNEVTSVTISDSEKTLTLGQVDSLFADSEFTGDITPSITWTTSNSLVCEVNKGEIKAITKGNAVITAQAGNKTATCNVTVSNEIKPVLSKGELWFWGDVYETGISNNFIACIASTGINLENLTGDGEFMYLEFNTDTLVTNNIPAGTYEMDKTLKAGTLVPAWVDTDNYPWGTWYFGDTYNDVISGIVRVTVENNIYTFQYNLVDYFGNNISGVYTGQLTYIDFTQSNTAQSVKNKIKIGNKRLSDQSKVFKRII
ncbi:MAG TPA: Ig-like domain-containing protein, partial [Paludibacter sp.]|nr:Ig-like domain-containing protein [Paludibacter sp.]